MLANVVRKLQKNLRSQSRGSVLRDLDLIDEDAKYVDDAYYFVDGSIDLHQHGKYGFLSFSGQIKAKLNPNDLFREYVDQNRHKPGFKFPRVAVLEKAVSENSPVVKSAQDLVKRLLNCEVDEEPISGSLGYTKLTGKDGYEVQFGIGNYIYVRKDYALKDLRPEIDELRKIFGRPSVETTKTYRLGK